MTKPKLMSGITFNVLVLGATSLLTDVSSEMILALLPFFMVDVLGAEMVVFGLIEGAAETTASLLRGFSGWLSDKMRRKASHRFGLLDFRDPKAALRFRHRTVHVFIVRILDRVGKGVRTAPRDALIADSVEAGRRGKAYGFHRSMDTLGAVIGPLTAFLLFPILWYRGVFLASVFPGMAVVVLPALAPLKPKS